MQMLVVSGLFFRFVVGPLAKAIHPSASASGLFPLWLRAPRFLGAALSSHSLPAGRELGAALVWGEEGILPPARAHPRSFGFHPSHNPLPRFHRRGGWCRFRYGIRVASSGSALAPKPWPPKEEPPPRRDANPCPKSARRRADFSRPCAHAPPQVGTSGDSPLILTLTKDDGTKIWPICSF